MTKMDKMVRFIKVGAGRLIARSLDISFTIDKSKIRRRYKKHKIILKTNDLPSIKPQGGTDGKNVKKKTNF